MYAIFGILLLAFLNAFTMSVEWSELNALVPLVLLT